MKMKAAVLEQWGSIAIRDDVPVPVPGENEVLIKVKYAGICGTDLHIYDGHHPTARTPLIPGHEFVGTVERIGARGPGSGEERHEAYGKVTNGQGEAGQSAGGRTAGEQTAQQLKIGDRVVVEPLISCGECGACREGNVHVCRQLQLLGIQTNGGFAEYVTASLDKTIRVDDSVPDKVAAMAEPFAVGYHVNRRAGVGPGDRVLVIGGGPIGLIVGLVARENGAALVAFSEIQPARIAQVRAFGFARTINPAEEDATAKAEALTDGEGFDIVIEVSGSQAGLSFATQACRIRGKVVFVGFPGSVPQVNVLEGIFKELTFIGSRVYTFDDFRQTVKLLGRMAADPGIGLERLVTDVRAVEQLEASIREIKTGRNNGKILIGFENGEAMRT